MKSHRIIITSLALITCVNGGINPTDTEQSMIKAYHEASTWQGKRDACLKLIDASVLRRGVPITNIQKMFGDDLFVASGKVGSEAVLFVHFQKQPKSNGSEGAIPFVGWYLMLKTNQYGAVESYSLSNLHK